MKYRDSNTRSTKIIIIISIFISSGYNYPGGNQFRANGTYCDRECGLEGLKENCPIKTFAPVNRLYCNDGYARDYNCVCVPLGNCPRCAYYYTNWKYQSTKTITQEWNKVIQWISIQFCNTKYTKHYINIKIYTLVKTPNTNQYYIVIIYTVYISQIYFNIFGLISLLWITKRRIHIHNTHTHVMNSIRFKYNWKSQCHDININMHK